MEKPNEQMTRHAVATFVAVVLTHVLADFMGMTVWPIYKTLAGLDVAKAGWIATIVATGGTALQPLFGSVADRFGARRMILWGTLLTFFSVLLGPLVNCRQALDAWLPSVFGFSGFYLVVFIILAAGRIGQDMFHPAGAALAGGFSAKRGALFLAIFIAMGSIGYGLSQIAFRTVFNQFDHHTEILLIPAAMIWIFAWFKCRPEPAAHAGKKSVVASFRALRPVAVQILLLFFMLAISSGVMGALFFLLPELAQEKGYPAWLGQGGAFGLIVFGSTVFMVPMGYLADRFGKLRTLLAIVILSTLSYHALIRLTPTAPVFMLVCVVGGAFMGTVNPLGVALGQKIAPRENMSVVSAILMGWAWCLASTAPSIAGELYQRLGHNASRTLSLMSFANLLMVVLTLMLIRVVRKKAAEAAVISKE